MPGGGPLPLPHRFLRERKEQSVTASEQAATGALGELGDLGSRCERSCGPQRPRPSSVGVAGRGLSSRRPTRTATSRLPPCTMQVSRQAQERVPLGRRRASERSRKGFTHRPASRNRTDASGRRYGSHNRSVPQNSPHDPCLAPPRQYLFRRWHQVRSGERRSSLDRRTGSASGVMRRGSVSRWRETACDGRRQLEVVAAGDAGETDRDS